MPIPDASYSLLDDICSRLSAESILAQPGSDEGLIPIYSLLNDWLEAAGDEAALVQPVRELQAKLDAKLEAAQPFDELTLAAVHQLIAWLPKALAAAREGKTVELDSESAVPAAAPVVPAEGEGDDTPADMLLDLNLAENSELLTEFHSEAIDHLQQIEAALLTLDAAPDDRDALNSLFRSFHTIKGVSGFLHLTPMHTLTHEVESLMDLARTGKLKLSSAIVTVILQSRDAVQEMIAQITQALERNQLPDRIVPVGHLIRQVRHLAATGVGAAPAAPAPVVPMPEPVVQTPASPAPAAEPEAVAPILPIASATPAPAAPLPQTAPPAPVAPPAPAKSSTAGSSASAAPTAASTVRVNTEKLDSLMDMVGELVIVQSQLQESARGLDSETSQLARNLTQLNRITKELQHNAMSLRMIPIKPTFQRMERLVRDLSREFGKKIAFNTAGEDTEIDRTVTEEIADPLVHMVRNALDHGLETPAERVANGKPEQGNVTLRAYHEGSSLVIELSDDGRGINPEKVLRKAQQQGLVAPDVKLSDNEIFQLIFLPGFSTAEKVTSVSGRGVGMDVVRRNIEKLRGSIHIDSKLGEGSTFRVRLPLTTAIIDGLLVRVGPDRFILPSTTVQMALRPVRSALTKVQGRGEVLDHRGRLLPLHRLHRRFAIGGAIEDPVEGIVVVMENGNRPYALLVDELLNKQEVVVKNLGSFLQQLPGVAGGAILGDGNIALILDPTSLCAA
jgi:two-component system, chemotaxis family, sensor kinase CheA